MTYFRPNEKAGMDGKIPGDLTVRRGEEASVATGAIRLSQPTVLRPRLLSVAFLSLTRALAAQCRHLFARRRRRVHCISAAWLR